MCVAGLLVVRLHIPTGVGSWLGWFVGPMLFGCYVYLCCLLGMVVWLSWFWWFSCLFR